MECEMNDELKALGEVFANELRETFIKGADLRAELSDRLTGAGLNSLDICKLEWICIHVSFGGKWVRRIGRVMSFHFYEGYFEVTVGDFKIRWSETNKEWEEVLSKDKTWPIAHIERI